jgi:peptidyl-prolyl cis-trans isomerase B (cyclophilin B)
VSSQPPVQRKGGSTKRPKGPRVENKVAAKPTFSRGTIGVLIALAAIAALSISIGLGGFASTPKALASAKPSPSASATTPSASATPSATASASGTPSATASTSALPAVRCTYTKEAGTQSKFVGLPNPTATPGVKTATVTTSAGKIVFELSAKTPCTENSFAFLASKKYFDSTVCHRLLDPVGATVLQCGDPLAKGNGAATDGAGGPGYKFADENLAGATYPRGTVAMANAGLGTNGSQFFFVVNDSKFPPSYTPFGRVTSGLDVLNAIAAAGTSNGSTDGPPASHVTIYRLTVN